MSESRENVVQLEFNLVEFHNMKHILNEAQSRASDGKRIKLVVRVFDKDGVLTKHVRMMQTLRIRSGVFYRRLPRDFHKWQFLKRWVFDWRRRRLAADTLDARTKVVVLAVDVLRRTIKHGGLVGIEESPGAPLRFAWHNEVHELLETARCAKSVWVFVFKPNKLLADSNSLIAYTF